MFIVDYVNKDYADKEKYAKYVEQRKFFSSNKYNDFVAYVQTGAKDKVQDDFVAYAMNNEKSKGIFNQNGLLKAEQLNPLRDNLSATESPIWHGIISFEEDTGLALMNTYEKAYAYFNKVFPKFLKKAGFKKDNIEWFAGLHTNTENRHIHFAFYEKEPMHYRAKDKVLQFSKGKIARQVLIDCRAEFGFDLVDNSTKLAELRSELIKSMKNSYLDDEEINTRLYRKLEKLSAMLPQSGRLQYDSEYCQNIQPYIDDITFFMIDNKLSLKKLYADYGGELERRDLVMSKVCKDNKLNPSKYLLKDKCYRDLYKRLGNIVIDIAIECRQKQRVKDYNSKRYFYEKMQRRKHRKFLLDRAMYLSQKYDEEVMQTFEEYREKLYKNEKMLDRDVRSWEMD